VHCHPRLRDCYRRLCPDRRWARDIYLLYNEETFEVTLSDHETPIRTIADGLAMIGLAQALRLLLEINVRV
jgi:hypothetical protein